MDQAPAPPEKKDLPFETWVVDVFHRHRQTDRVSALDVAQQKAQLLCEQERRLLGTAYGNAAAHVRRSGQLVGRAQLALLALGCAVTLAFHQVGLGLWSTAPLSGMLLVALRKRWICSALADTYSTVSQLLKQGSPR
ncbi:hypothetical protein QX25_18525 (plasmid) [Stutzerimonas stutzeri]|nr:hypothetical protein QX25_18525 [Stutzerimonas stutzeri]